MPNVRITELPEVDSSQLQNNAPGNTRAQTTYLPCVTDGVTKKIVLSDLSGYRSSGSVKEVSAGSSMSITTNVQTGISFAAFTLPGAIFIHSGLTPPDGYLFCDGRAVSRSLYNDLFLAIGTFYGPGDNRSTFNLPDLRGRTPFGFETMGGVASSNRLTNPVFGGLNGSSLGSAGGEAYHVLTLSETALPSHSHSFSATTTVSAGPECVDNRSSGCNPSALDHSGSCGTTAQYSYTDVSWAQDGSATAHQNLPPLVFLNYIIRY
ncbi:MAG: hypothetical protein EBU96_04190 [Actinobacteria bacterium]|nr:hypothetical protein [Actinomycetota bacterium]